jgi:hypothetical protein
LFVCLFCFVLFCFVCLSILFHNSELWFYRRLDSVSFSMCLCFSRSCQGTCLWLFHLFKTSSDNVNSIDSCRTWGECKGKEQFWIWCKEISEALGSWRCQEVSQTFEENKSMSPLIKTFTFRSIVFILSYIKM